MAKSGATASKIAIQLGNRTRNAVIGLLHRRKIMMSIFQNKPYPTKLPKKTRNKTPTLSISASKPQASPSASFSKENYKLEDLFENKAADVIYGQVSILDAHRTQCRWLTSSPIVCGDPVVNSSSWCKDHYQRVFTPYSVAKAATEELRKRKLRENWQDRRI